MDHAPPPPDDLAPPSPGPPGAPAVAPLAPPPASPPPASPPHTRSWWRLPWLLLVAAQAALTLALFGPGPRLERLLDDQPVLSGRHPLHLYHGTLGARAFLRNGRLCCYDPGFQAGYPKTPVFDAGSRPAELTLILAGGRYSPAAYKLGLFAIALLVPVLAATAARGAGLSGPAACLATAFALLAWWAGPARGDLLQGDLSLLLAALAALALFGLLLRFDRAPGVAGWLGLLLAGLLGWFAQPVFFAALGLLALVYYLTVGPRHTWPWHLALAAALVAAPLAHAFWLADYMRYWWILGPLDAGLPRLSHRTFITLWQAPLWGSPADRALAVALAALALAGTLRFNRSRRRAAARLFGLATLACLALALAGACHEPIGRLGAAGLLTPALLFAAVPAAHAAALPAAALARALTRLAGGPTRAALAGLLVLAGPAWLVRGPLTALARRAATVEPLVLGLGPQRQAVVDALRRHTTPDARILWEDHPDDPRTGHWTALLPLLTADPDGRPRAFLGGLAEPGTIEHDFASFPDETLAGRPIGQWSDADLADFCRRYNVGWVVGRSAATLARLRGWPVAAPLPDGARLVTAPRTHSFTLKGHAVCLRADPHHVALADVQPEDGQVVLCLHYQAGLRASPSRVQVEREIDPYDPIPFVRLRVPGPLTRVTLTWDR